MAVANVHFRDLRAGAIARVGDIKMYFDVPGSRRR